MKIASWNINSVRLRKEMVAKFLDEYCPDILCLQETKCQNDQFPDEFFSNMGYKYQNINGMKSYNGVAILSKIVFLQQTKINYCQKEDARIVAVQVKHKKIKNNLWVYNYYVPAGGEEPDPKINIKFAHKLAFLEELNQDCKTMLKYPAILLGDLNIAPFEHDVWSHKQLRNVVSHTQIEIENYKQIVQSGEWLDIARKIYPEDKKLYSWWSYRAKDHLLSNRGRRLDHIWLNKQAQAPLDNTYKLSFHNKYRSLERPSDHIPIMLEF